MKYCFDTSALIGLGERHYPEHIPVFTPIWNHLYSEIESDNIVSVDFVKTELEEKADDWRENFLIKADKMFHINNLVEAEYAKVISEIETGAQFLNNRHRTLFMGGADPWVIALARTLGDCTVISAETKKLADYGLGEVCKQLDVKHAGLVKFFEENNIGK